jgi:UDP-glucose 4-epimerase
VGVTQPLSLVLGACGGIGSHLVEVLIEAGHRVRAADSATAAGGDDDPRRGLFPAAVGAAGAELVPVDLGDRASIARALDGVGLVFDAAANVDATQALVDALLDGSRPGREAFARVVLIGDGGIYGLPSPERLPVTEETPPAPPTDELRRRWEQERLVATAGRERGLAFTTLRPAGVYGPRLRVGGGFGLLDPALVRLRAPGPVPVPVPVAVPSSFTARVPFVHVRDVARAALHVALDERAAGEAYNVCDDSLMSRVDFWKMVAEIRGARFVLLPPVPVEVVRPLSLAVARAVELLAEHHVARGQLPIDPVAARAFGHDLVYSSEKLKRLGFTFRYPDARGGIEETIAWYADRGWLDGTGGGSFTHGH